MDALHKYLHSYLHSPVAIVCALTAPHLLPAPCQAVEYLSIEQAQAIAFPQAETFKVAHVLFTPEQKKAIEGLSGVPVVARAQKIWQVLGKDESSLGWFVVDYVVGKHLIIDYAIAISTQQEVLDVEILSYRESYGGEIRSPNWLQQFQGKTKNSVLTLNKDITNIGGATLSSRHVTEGVKRVLATIHVTQ